MDTWSEGLGRPVVETSETSVGGAAAPEKVGDVELAGMLKDIVERRGDVDYEKNFGDDEDRAKQCGLWVGSGEKMIGYLIDQNVDPAKLQNAELFVALQELWLLGPQTSNFDHRFSVMKVLREECERRLQEYYRCFGAHVSQFIFREHASELYITLVFERKTFDTLSQQGVFALDKVLPRDTGFPDVAEVLVRAQEASEKVTLSLEEIKSQANGLALNQSLQQTEKMLDLGLGREAKKKLLDLLVVRNVQSRLEAVLSPENGSSLAGG